MTLSFTAIKQTIVSFLQRYHAMIFVVVVIGGLIAIVLVLNNIVFGSDQQVAPASNPGNSFDKTTIDRIDKLRTGSDAVTPLDLSHGRTNPFVE